MSFVIDDRLGLTMIVAVAPFLPSFPSFPPPQHSPMLGHFASSHTVCRPSPRRSFLISAYEPPAGIECLRKDGRRGLEGEGEDVSSSRRAEPLGAARHSWTDCLVFPSVVIRSSSRWFPAMKSPRVKPSSSLAIRDWRVERARLEGGVELEEAAGEEGEAEEDGEGTGETIDGEQAAEVLAIERTSERETH